jgi:hypothetical protein
MEKHLIKVIVALRNFKVNKKFYFGGIMETIWANLKEFDYIIFKKEKDSVLVIDKSLPEIEYREIISRLQRKIPA